MSASILKFVRDDILDLDAGEQSEFESQLVELVSSFIFASCKGEEKTASQPGEPALAQQTKKRDQKKARKEQQSTN